MLPAHKLAALRFKSEPQYCISSLLAVASRNEIFNSHPWGCNLDDS